MSKIFGFTLTESEDFFPGAAIYPNPKDANLFLSLGRHVDVYYPLRKRSRVSAPFVPSGEILKKKETSIEVLPDECLFEIFRRLPDRETRSLCACVSKRWLMLLSSISGNEFCSTSENLKPKTVSTGIEADNQPESDGYLSRNLEGKKATDVRLAAIAVGNASCGGLGKLSIRGSNHGSEVTNLGLKAVSHGCPSLKAISLWNLFSIGDEGLIEIAKGCHLLEKLDLCECPGISNKALLELAKNCPNLTDITMESCANIGNESLQALGQYCSNLKSISVKDCPLIGDQGISSLLSSTSYTLNKVKLQGLNVTDVSLAVIGHYGKAVTDLMLTGLTNVTERGFWVMGNGHGLQKLRSFTLTSCHGVTDVGLQSIGKGCPNLRKFCLRKCSFLSDNGMVSFAQAAASIENLQLEECHRITQLGLFGTLLNCGAKLKILSLVNCLGIKDLSLNLPSLPPCKSLQSISICNCPGFGNASLTLLGKLCPKLQHVNLTGLNGITDSGLLPMLKNCEAGLVKVNLSGCVNLTDKVISSLAELHGWTLELLNLGGCSKVSDASLVAVAENCQLLNDLDMSKCRITDFGIAALARANQFNLQILSVFGCPALTDKSLPALARLGDSLLGLNLQQCNSVSTRSVELLLAQLHRCDILY
ncbi:EIN3-binding F-box protein 1-like [Momordica charantia]|uniref:EIN3-binding F-box protein 1-like n=1 Tax=Momordica charantia TaxID=3673 RepID=A0A6J1BPN4_MOMCH|nr:EIN3-binding F-box protein 1-like [Momordica charantia]